MSREYIVGVAAFVVLGAVIGGVVGLVGGAAPQTRLRLLVAILVAIAAFWAIVARNTYYAAGSLLLAGFAIRQPHRFWVVRVSQPSSPVYQFILSAAHLFALIAIWPLVMAYWLWLEISRARQQP